VVGCNWAGFYFLFRFCLGWVVRVWGHLFFGLMKVVLDSSVWVAFFLEDDFFHQRARAEIKNILTLRDQILVTRTTCVEVMNVLIRNNSNSEDLLWQINVLKKYLHKNDCKFVEIAIKWLKVITLKTPDLLILIENELARSEKFITYDIKQANAYQNIPREG
jgi:predicted nucleic acid-binding protein